MQTTYISINGQLVEVPVGSTEFLDYEQNSVTDIGNPIYFANLSNNETTLSNEEQTEPTVTPTPEPTITPTPAPTETPTETQQNEVELLENAVELLAENSTTVTGTVNSTVLGIMDRIIDGYPDYYEYAGFRIDADDSYRSTLYISKHGTYENGVITFGDDCIAVDFYRYSTSGYSSYVYYETTESPNATVDVSSDTIVYTNTIEGYPHLGTVTKESDSNLWIMFFLCIMLVIFLRRKNHA